MNNIEKTNAIEKINQKINSLETEILNKEESLISFGKLT